MRRSDHTIEDRLKRVANSMSAKVYSRIITDRIRKRIGGSSGLNGYCVSILNSSGTIERSYITLNNQLEGSKRLVIFAHEIGHLLAHHSYSEQFRIDMYRDSVRFEYRAELDAWRHAGPLLKDAGFDDWEEFNCWAKRYLQYDMSTELFEELT